ncbi:MAG: hypothetical protein ABR549_10700 [Mycobacteriales bacterium]
MPLRTTFAVTAVGHYCPNYSTSSLLCRGGSRNANVSLKRTAISSSSSTLPLLWTPPSTPSRHLTVTMTYTIASNGDAHTRTSTSG